jgi:hypothetical protein
MMLIRTALTRYKPLKAKDAFVRTVWKLPFSEGQGKDGVNAAGQTSAAPTTPTAPADEEKRRSFTQRLWKKTLTATTVNTDENIVNTVRTKKPVSPPSTVYDVEYWLSLVPDQIMGDKMKETVRDLFKIAEGLYGRMGKQPVHPLVLNIALLRLYANQLHDEQQEKIALQERQTHFITEEFTAEVLHHFNYASEVYGSDPLIRQQDVVLNQLDDDRTLHLPRHIIFLDHLTKSIVVSIRGTKSIADMITDLYIKEIPFLEPMSGILAHRGIAQSAEALLPSVTKAVHEVKQRENGRYTDYRVVTTGHSLGAGTAALLSILLSTQSKIPVTSYAFAPPPIISHPVLPKPKFPYNLFSREVDCKIYCFVHDRDFISRCSHMELLQMLSSLTAVDSLPWTDFERAAMVYRGKMDPKEMSAVSKVLQSAKAGFSAGKDATLYLPGEIFLLRPVPAVKVDDVQDVPGASSPALKAIKETKDGSVSDTSKTAAENASSTWQQLVEKTVSLHGISVLSSRRATPAESAGDKERGSEVAAEAPDTRVQYEMVRVPTAESLFNGLLYCGDSMVHDHLLNSYRRALLKLVV